MISSATKIETTNTGFVLSTTPSKLTFLDKHGTTMFQHDFGVSISIQQVISKRLSTFVFDGTNYVFAGMDGLYLVPSSNIYSVSNTFPYGADYACATILMKDNNYLILGQNVSTNNFHLIEMDNLGNILASPQIGFQGFDMIATNNGFLVVGTDGTSTKVKNYDNNLVELWSNTYSAGTAYSVTEQGGTFAIAGVNGTDGKLIKIDASGGIIFSVNYPNISNNGRIRVVSANEKNGFVIATNSHILKTDEVGIIHTPQQDLYTNGSAIINVNNVKTMINPDGGLFWDYNDAYFHSPADNTTNTIFASGLWMGAFDDGYNLKVAAETYGSTGKDYRAGFITQGSLNGNVDRVWKISKESNICLHDTFSKIFYMI